MIGDRINLMSRRGNINSFLVEIEDNVYEWNTNCLSFQISFNNDDVYMLDPEDGPAIYVGFEFGNKTIDCIKREMRDGSKKYIVYTK